MKNKNAVDDLPPLHSTRVLPWQMFTKDFLGLDKKVDDKIKNIINNNLTERIDFRPYTNDNPMTVFETDALLKCCELFRKMHLRHLIVISSEEVGKIVGIITRQDLFKWLDL